MKKFLFILIAIPLLMGAGCTSKNTNDETDNNSAVESSSDNDIEADNDKMENKQDEETSKTEIKYNLYENKAMGYTILIPEKWYWQHFMKNEIDSEKIDDYLAVDKDGITPLGSERIAKILVEKSSMGLDDLTEGMDGYSKTQKTVAGVSAARYEKQFGEDNEMYPNSKIVQYHLEKNGQTYRLIFNSEGTVKEDIAEYETIFEEMVKSFSFVE